MILFVYRIWIPMMNGSPREKTHVYPKITHGWTSMTASKKMKGLVAQRGREVWLQIFDYYSNISLVFMPTFFLALTTIFNVGPRNLNTSTSKIGKEKVGDFLVDEDDDVEVIDDDGGEEELDEGTIDTNPVTL